jgi:hypothetical protein
MQTPARYGNPGYERPLLYTCVPTLPYGHRPRCHAPRTTRPHHRHATVHTDHRAIGIEKGPSQVLTARGRLGRLSLPGKRGLQ